MLKPHALPSLRHIRNANIRFQVQLNAVKHSTLHFKMAIILKQKQSKNSYKDIIWIYKGFHIVANVDAFGRKSVTIGQRDEIPNTKF